MLSPVRVHAPNITGMYSELFYTYSIHLNDRSLAPPSPEVMYAAPCFLVPPRGVHLHTWGVGTSTYHVVLRLLLAPNWPNLMVLSQCVDMY